MSIKRSSNFFVTILNYSMIFSTNLNTWRNTEKRVCAILENIEKTMYGVATITATQQSTALLEMLRLDPKQESGLMMARKAKNDRDEGSNVSWSREE